MRVAIQGLAPIAFDLSPNGTVLAFTTALAAATSIIFGLAPDSPVEVIGVARDSRYGTLGDRRSTV